MKYRDILEGVLHSVTASLDFLPHEGRDPEIWDDRIPSWRITGFDYVQEANDDGEDYLRIELSWTATILFPNGRQREVQTTYSFRDRDFQENYGIRGLIMNFHDHVCKALNLSIIPKE